MAVRAVSLEQKVLDNIKAQRLIAPGKKLLVAVSGGPDSVCLLHTLWSLHKELGIELYVAHLNHLLRGAESDGDAAYVKALARKLGIPLTVASRDVKAYRASHHLSLEEAARELRYAFLAETAVKIGAQKVAVGHTSDDHVETILMHLLRGSGTRGLRGLLPSSKYKGSDLTIIRPLLDISRKETAAYCAKRRLQPRTDSSNASKALFRNRIRLELLPLLRRYNPQVGEALKRAARLAADDFDFVEKEAALAADDIMRREGNAVVFDKKVFLGLPLALQRSLIRRALDFLLGELKDIEARHVEDILSALRKPAGRVIKLPAGLNFTIEYDKYLLAPAESSVCPFPPIDKEIALKIPGKTRVPGGEIVASLYENDGAKVEESDRYTGCFDFVKTGKTLMLRRRAPGDRFQPLGLAALKKLNAFMIDARIPRSWRERIPVIASPEQVIWVTGWRIDERVKVTRTTKQVLRLEYRPRKP